MFAQEKIKFMKKRLLKHAVSFVVLTVMLVMPIMAMPTLTTAQEVDDYTQGDLVRELNINQGSDLLGVVTDVINIVLGLLGLIAVIMILISGFEWMTASGDTDKVKNAQTRMQQALVGLVIIFLAWVIVGFVLNTLVGKIR